MLPTKLKPNYILSALIVLLATVASLGGFFLPDLYRDNSYVTPLWIGNDLVTLVIAVPLLVISLILARRGSLRAQLVWLAMLDVTLYNYGFYLFGAAFNGFFLMYVALFTLSIFALIFGMINIDANQISQHFRARTPVKWISGYRMLVGIGLSTIYVAHSLGFVATGQLPPIVVKTGHPTSVIFALDLSLLVPIFVLGAVWLWQRQPWGFVLAAISIIKGATYTLVLTVVSIWGANAGVPGALDEMPMWLSLTVVGLVASLLLLGNFELNPARAPLGKSQIVQG